LADPSRHPRERRLRAISNTVLSVGLFGGLAAWLGAGILTESALVFVLGGAAYFAVGGLLLWRFVLDPTRPRTSAALAADAAENPDPREAALPYGATFDGEGRVVLPWVRWKRVGWTAFAVVSIFFAVLALTDAGEPPAGLDVFYVSLSLSLLLRQLRYRRPGLVLDPDGLWQPYTGARVRWGDIERAKLTYNPQSPWQWLIVRGRRGSVTRPGWSRFRRRIVIPVDALYIDGWDLELLLGPERYTIASSAQSSAAAPK